MSAGCPPCATERAAAISTGADSGLQVARLSLDQIKDSLDTDDFQALAFGEATCGANESWEPLVDDASLEKLADFVRSLLAALARHGSEAPALVDFGSAFLGSASATKPASVACALSGFLAGLADAGNPVLSVGRPSRKALATVCQAWISSGGPAKAVTSFLRGRELPSEAEATCTTSLCSLRDHLAQLFCEGSAAREVSESILEHYTQSFTAAVLEEWFSQLRAGSADSRSVNLLSRLLLRGDAPLIAVRLCGMFLLDNSDSLHTVSGDVFQKLADVSVAAACNLACAVLAALDGVLAAADNKLQASSESSLLLLPRLFAHVRPDSPIQQLFAERLWRLQLGGQLGAAVLFCLVDFLTARPGWDAVLRGWLHRWADRGLLQSADPLTQRSLALRLARVLGRAPARRAGFLELDGDMTQLLLTGVQLRLGAQVPESRWHGMAVAEVMARSWPGKDEGEDPAELRFDGFDLGTCGLAAFRFASAEFVILPGDASREMAIAFPPGTAAAALRAHLEQRGRDKSDMASTAAAGESPSTAAPLLSAEELQGKAEGQADIIDTCAAAESAAESDSDDEDDPLQHFTPLQPLSAPRDDCADLRLAQPPGFLRSAYEMLAGQSKGYEGVLAPDASTVGSRSSQQAPNVVRARILVTLKAIPALAKSDPPELKQLGGPLTERLLRLTDAPGVGDNLELRRAALASLLAADGSRRAACRLLIKDFAAEDLALATRFLVLDALAAGARDLSGQTSQSSAATPGAAVDGKICTAGKQPEVGTSTASNTAGAETKTPGDSKASGRETRTRRFASATKEAPSRKNRFAAELRCFLPPLIARWRRPDAGAARWAMAEPQLIGALLHCAGVLLECAGRACPDRDVVSKEALGLVEEFFQHADPYVRRCSIFLLSRLLLLGSEALLVDHLPLLEHLELATLREGDDICRRMVGGVLACLEQKGVI